MKKTPKIEFTKIEIAPGESLVDERLRVCPTEPGVYVMKDEFAHVIYVGKAKNLRSRVRSYFQDQASHSAKTQHLVSKVRDIEFVRVGSEAEALLLENNLIKKWKPKYNIRLKDDKTYPYIMLGTSHPFPRPYIARKQFKTDGNEYFGPFPFSGALRAALSMAAKVFQLRDCRDHEFANRSRPCLSYEIGQCTAPCVGYVTPEAYAQQVKDFRDFLNGEKGDLEVRWEKEMEEAAEAMEFEKAARLRDRLNAVRSVVGQESRVVSTSDLNDRDVWALWPLLEKSGEVAEEETIDGTDEPSPAGTYLDISIMQFRGGKLEGQIHRTADISEGLETEDFMANLLMQHYGKHELPSQIVVPTDARLPERSEFALALQNLKEAAEPPSIYMSSDREEWTRLYELALENVRGMHEEQNRIRERREDGLIAIARMLELPRPPERLECVDISNFQGEANVASCVVFSKGRPDKNQYRHYKIAGFSGQNDFASMREVMSRRYGKPDSPKPDLLVIDGGKGQLQAAREILQGLGCDFPIVGLAKARTQRNFRSEEVEASEERVFVPGQKNPIKFKNSEALRILTHLRDEAHRFAIEFHRLKRSQARGLE